ncbi:MAG: P-II family nitrogen regulator [Gammaproteobacteria bacterium]|nr:P-II family nitrogen regulator [Gammaproteobacteria bacterium]MCF6261647.1 P-II family nitrogen regulator [Gammaproteobacteria bacterium]
MNFRKVTAIIRCESCKKVEKKLQKLGVHGFSISKVKGYGEYADLYSNDWLVSHARIEIFTEISKAEEIAEAIMEAAHVGLEGDGIIAVLPVEQLYRIRTQSKFKPHETEEVPSGKK